MADDVAEPAAEDPLAFLPRPIVCVLRWALLDVLDDDDEFPDTVRKISVTLMGFAAVSPVGPLGVYMISEHSRRDDQPAHNGGVLIASFALFYCVGIVLPCFAWLRCTRQVPVAIGSYFFVATAILMLLGCVSSPVYPGPVTSTCVMLVTLGAGLPRLVQAFSIFVALGNTAYSAARRQWPEAMVPDYHAPSHMEGFFVEWLMATGALVVTLGYALATSFAFGSKLTKLSKAQRDNSLAPTDAEEPVAVMFTDIQSSTHLWATVPEVMANALERHNVVIREAIAAHQGYEVKTVGDSFVVVFKTVDDALGAALKMQEGLFHAQWGDNGAIDAAYRAFSDFGSDTTARPHVPDDAGLYAASWNGLRVRAAVHVGLCDIKFDDITKGFDYFGSTMNTAARIEGVGFGGQICLSHAAKAAVSRAVPTFAYVAASLGAHDLRGVPEPVTLTQYLPACLARRRFPALRATLGLPADDLGSVSSSDGTVQDDVSVDVSPAAAHFDVMLSALPVKERAPKLREFCRAWNVEWRQGRSFNAHLVRLGQKIDRVTAAKPATRLVLPDAPPHHRSTTPTGEHVAVQSVAPADEEMDMHDILGVSEPQ